MPASVTSVPEPNKENEQEKFERADVHVFVNSSEEEEIDDENIPTGYQPLNAVADQLDISSDEEGSSSDDNNEQSVETAAESLETEALSINTDLIRDVMKNIKLDESKIPKWAVEISDSKWNEVVKQTITTVGETENVGTSANDV
uniref:male-enhanced antigen 1 n=1 Tax=Ciona intestinalis TaxID=7719 RepID=UPI000180B9B2|nr:male-enhanced antigen 1 [Ciona intestinalis]|eukprot:XP_009859704.1 male-enhanced antigen 1 [Ciona intestinalis]